MDPRRLILLAAAPVGVVVGSAVWLVAPSQAASEKVAHLNSRVVSIASPQRVRTPDALAAANLPTTPPLFALTTGPGAVADVALKLEGLARAPGHVAALLAINGGTADWLQLGDTRDGVTLEDVAADRVTVDTPTGMKDVLLGDTTAPLQPADGRQRPTALVAGSVK